MTIREALKWARGELNKTSSSPGLDAEMLLGEVLKKDFAFLLAHDDQELTEEQEQIYRKLIEKRQKGMPVSYLLGKKEFYGLEFEVGEGVLVPRADTEVLVEMVLEYLKSKILNPLRLPSESLTNFQTSASHSERNSPRRMKRRISGLGHGLTIDTETLHSVNSVLSDLERNFLLIDVGVGSGCIPISILKNAPNMRGLGLEVSPDALKIAKRNAEKLGVGDRLTLLSSDLLQSLPQDFIEDQSWILVANLPYIPEDWPKHFSTKFEPDVALFGGRKGVDLYHRLAEQIEVLKNKPEALFFECFEFQVESIEGFLPSYSLVETRKMTGEAVGVRLDLQS